MSEEENDVVVYSTPTCPYCDKLKSYLDQKGVDYTDYNVASNKEKAKEMIQKTGQRGVPVSEVNGEVIIGFDQDKVDKALEGS